MTVKWPAYDELDRVGPDADACAWGVFGDTDELGTINFITSEVTASATRVVRNGTVITLSRPSDGDTQVLSANRRRSRHEILVSRGGRDDRLDDYFPQGASQLDSLAHVRYRDLGYYGARGEDDLDNGALGVDRIARHGVVTRGVLVDVQRHMYESGHTWRPDQRSVIGPELLEAVLHSEGATLRTGDVVIIRTGWGKWFDGLNGGERSQLEGSLSRGEAGLHCAGIAAAPEMVEWLWNTRVAIVASDNPGVEAFPVRRNEGFLHRRLIALLGMPLGELWDLEELSAACRQHGRYDFMVTVSPLMQPCGVGSPANAYAVL